MSVRLFLTAAMAALLTGCGSPVAVERAPRVSERIILLPSDTPRGSAIVVKFGDTESVMDSGYARVELRGNTLTTSATTAEEVERRYGGLLAATAPKPQPYTMYFTLGTDELTPSSKAAFEDARRQIAAWSGAEVVVIGHTDRMGTEQYNNQLSRQRALMIATRLVLSGVSPDAIAVAARGELEPLVHTADGVAEPRNRRVEIKVR